MQVSEKGKYKRHASCLTHWFFERGGRYARVPHEVVGFQNEKKQEFCFKTEFESSTHKGVLPH